MIDPEREPQEADRFGVTEPGVLAARCGAEKAQSPWKRRPAFDEGAITSLILKVARPSGHRLYAVTGHGEPEVDDLETADGLGAVAEALRDDNIEILPAVPRRRRASSRRCRGGRSSPAPSRPLIPHELDALRTYLAKGGRLLALIDPGPDVGLAPLLADYKLALEDTMIVDREEIAFLGARLGLDPIVEEFPPHPITRGFKQRMRLSQARSITISVEGGLPGVDRRACGADARIGVGREPVEGDAHDRARRAGRSRRRGAASRRARPGAVAEDRGRLTRPAARRGSCSSAMRIG